MVGLHDAGHYTGLVGKLSTVIVRRKRAARAGFVQRIHWSDRQRRRRRPQLQRNFPGRTIVTPEMTVVEGKS